MDPRCENTSGNRLGTLCIVIISNLELNNQVTIPVTPLMVPSPPQMETESHISNASRALFIDEFNQNEPEEFSHSENEDFEEKVRWLLLYYVSLKHF